MKHFKMKTTDTNLWQNEHPRYLREFPDYDTELRMISGFEDSSWHNDAMPSISRYFKMDNAQPPLIRAVEVWQDYMNRERSEMAPYNPDEPYFRFCVDVTDDDEIAQPLLSTNDWREVEACALKAAAKLELEWRKRMC